MAGQEGRFQPMRLLTFAHRAEAQAFLHHFTHDLIDQRGLYRFDGAYLLIMGEGPIEASNQVSYVLGQFPEINEVFNFGVAGVLGDLELNQVVEARHGYLWNHTRPEFKSYPLGEGELDIVTSMERILSFEEAQKLLPMGVLVDREAWGVGLSCKMFRRPLKTFKYLSDKAGELGACELVKDKAKEASEILLETYLRHDPKSKDLASGFSLEGFYFTTAMERERDQLLERLSLKYKKEKKELITQNLLSEIKEKTPQAKMRAKILIDHLRMMTDPECYEVQSKLINLFKPFEDKGIKISFDPQFEKEEIGIQFRTHSNLIPSQMELLQTLPWEKLRKILSGEN